MKKLKGLKLSRNSLTSLENANFKEAPLIEFLVLNENKIQSLSSKVFEGLTSLKRIYLQNNEIREIADGVFDNLPSLKAINLQRNKLEGGVLKSLSEKYTNVNFMDTGVPDEDKIL